MKKNRHTAQKIVAKLRQADVELAKAIPVAQICKKLEISEQTYYRWRKKYGGMDPEMVKELKAIKKENARLKRVVADLAVDNAILREATEYSKNL